MKERDVSTFRSGLCALAILCLMMGATSSLAQAPRPTTSASRPVRVVAPDQIGALKILGSTIIAVDQADKTGNYSVLLGLGSAGFQSSNSAISLGAVFGVFRQQRIDLSDVLILSPSYEIAPIMVSADTFRMRGRYALPRGTLAFDLMYRWDNGWRLEAISLLPPSPPPGESLQLRATPGRHP